MRYSVISGVPLNAALKSGVSWSISSASIFAPLSIRNFTIFKQVSIFSVYVVFFLIITYLSNSFSFSLMNSDLQVLI